MNQSKKFKELIEAREILVMPGVWDGFSAQITEQAGFKTALVSGAAVSESRLGQPDVGIMGLTDNLQANRVIAESSNLILLADADTGYGNAVNVHFTTRAFEALGIGGVTIEDQVSPKRCGHIEGKQVIDQDEAVQKIRAAVEARRNPNFLIKARTDAARYHGIDEAIRRAQLYAEVGADFVAADAMMTEDDIRKFTKSVDAPVSVNMGFGLRKRPTTPLLSPRRLEDMGVAVVSYPRLLSAAGVKGMTTAMEEFKRGLEDDSVQDRPDLLSSFDELQTLMGLPRIMALESRYSA